MSPCQRFTVCLGRNSLNVIIWKISIKIIHSNHGKQHNFLKKHIMRVSWVGFKHMYDVELLFFHHFFKAPLLCSLCAHRPHSSSIPYTSPIHLLCQRAYLSYILGEKIWLHQLTLELGFLTWDLWTPKIICKILCLRIYVLILQKGSTAFKWFLEQSKIPNLNIIAKIFFIRRACYSKVMHV